ncbi:MAG: immunoglobulin domain-containing protein, partial [Limisphaerales bacterium]
VANGSGSITSIVANLVVSASPVITAEPQSQTVTAGSPANFSVGVEGATPLTFQWLKNGANLNNGGNISGANTATLQLSTTSAADDGGYHVIITNSFGSVTSVVATLNVASPPTITVQPGNRTVRGGATASFSVAATGGGPLSYQWFKNGASLIDGLGISGSTTTNLLVANATQADAAVYHVVVSNAAGSQTSASVTLTVMDGAGATIFHDTFESGNMNNWTTTGWHPLTSSTAHNIDPDGGTRSALMTISSNRMHRNIIADNGGSELSGAARVSWYIYDTAAASRIFNEVRGYSSGTGLPNGGTTASGSLGQLLAAGKYNETTMSGEIFDITKYQARVLTASPAGWFNLNAPGAPSRSIGWHKFEIERLSNGDLLFFVDGKLGRTITGANAQSWDTIILGPGLGNSLGDAWFDGFKVERLTNSPVFTASPQNVAANAGDTVTFSALVVGAGPVTYQWKKGSEDVVNGNGISGANSLVLTIEGVGTDDAGAYHLVATNADGSTSSAAATLTVSDIAPVIVSHPVARTNNAGSTATFSVEVTGTSVTYGWRKNGSPLVDGGTILGSTTATLVINDVRQADAGSYSVFVSNSAGNALSQSASLTVIDPPVVTEDPLSQTRNAGESVTFNVSVSGTDVSYQWFRNNQPISGATASSLIIHNLLAANSGDYAVRVSNAAGFEMSDIAVLTVIDPVIVTQPSDTVVPPGGTAYFSVAAVGTEVMTYLWKKNGVPLANGGKIAGANTPNLTITDVQFGDLATYSVTVASEAGGVIDSVGAELSFGAAPTILSHPESRTNNLGTTATFSVTATGHGTLSYQWQKGGVNLT